VLAGYDDSSERLKQILEENRIEISPAAHVYSLEKLKEIKFHQACMQLWMNLTITIRS